MLIKYPFLFLNNPSASLKSTSKLTLRLTIVSPQPKVLSPLYHKYFSYQKYITNDPLMSFLTQNTSLYQLKSTQWRFFLIYKLNHDDASIVSHENSCHPYAKLFFAHSASFLIKKDSPTLILVQFRNEVTIPIVTPMVTLELPHGPFFGSLTGS